MLVEDVGDSFSERSSMSNALSASLLLTPKPVCCQNDLAIGQTSLLKMTAWISIVGIGGLGPGSQTVSCANLQFEECGIMKSLQYDAHLCAGNRMRFSSSLPNFLRITEDNF